MNEATLTRLIAERKAGHGLPRAFYHDPDIYQRDIERIFLNSWIYAGHQSEITRVGDYFLFELAGESVIIVRSDEDTVHALLNVCRHRGSRVCLDTSGCSSRLVCRYHGWSYGLDGQLLAAGQMPDNFDPAGYGLKQIQVERIAGLIFINFAAEPAPFCQLREDMDHCLDPYDLGRATVAHRASYTIAANWKLAMENYCECYHCRPSHPEYSRGHILATPREKWSVSQAEIDRQAAAAGFCDDTFDRTWLHGRFGIECQHERYPLVHQHLTGSRDGQPLAPLLGEISEFVAAATDIQLGPALFGLAYNDHVVLFRFTPNAIDSTLCEVSWLVNESAVEGKDYQLEELTWLWDVTTIEDKQIIERNQQGVSSRFYQPGPFSKMEDFANRFVEWYLQALN